MAFLSTGQTKDCLSPGLWGRTSTGFCTHARALGCRAPLVSWGSPPTPPWGDPWLLLGSAAIEEKEQEEPQGLRVLA